GVCDFEIEVDLHSRAVQVEIQKQDLPRLLAPRKVDSQIDRDLVLTVILTPADERNDMAAALILRAPDLLKLSYDRFLDFGRRGFAVEKIARAGLHGGDDLRRHRLIAERDLPDGRKLDVDLLHDLEDRMFFGLYGLQIKNRDGRLQRLHARLQGAHQRA